MRSNGSSRLHRTSLGGNASTLASGPKTSGIRLNGCPVEQQRKEMLSQPERVQSLLGKYEELADFHRWGKAGVSLVRKRMKKDWKRARKRARHVPGTMSWLLDALASGHVWSGEIFTWRQ